MLLPYRRLAAFAPRGTGEDEMKAHLGMHGKGTRPMCGANIRRTSGISTDVHGFTTDWAHMQCVKCAAKLAAQETKAAKVAA